MLSSAAVLAFPLLLLSAVLGAAQVSANDPSKTTLFTTCQENEKPKHVLSPVSHSQDGKLRAYVEVDVQSDSGCLHTTRLWVTRAGEPYRLVYLMPPKRTAAGNGMEILSWAKNSSMLLVKTEEWQWGSDAPDTQQVLAIDAGTGMIYEPELEAMLQTHKDKRCSYRVRDAWFSAGGSVNILVRARFSTAMDVDETEADVPAAKRCGNPEETWSFNFATGEIRQVANAHRF